MKQIEMSLEVTHNYSTGYHPMTSFDSWRVAIYNEIPGKELKDIAYLEHHTLTDEVFILLRGTCILIVASGKDRPENFRLIEMEPLKYYNIKRGIWHNLLLSNEGSVTIVENDNTSRENSVCYYLDAAGKSKLEKLYGQLKHDL